MMDRTFVCLILFLQVVNSQVGINCPDCDFAVGVGTADAGDMFDPWAISYHLLQPSFKIQFTSGVEYKEIETGLQKYCKTGFLYDFASISESPQAIGLATQSNNLVGFPLYAFPVVFAYKVPEIDFGYAPLKLSQWILYQIYTLKITKWNDTQIQFNNPHVAEFLPGTDIILIIRTDSCSLTKAITRDFYRFDPITWPAEGTLTFPESIDYVAAGALFENHTVSATSAAMSNNYTLSFLPLNWAKEAGLPSAVIYNKKGWNRPMETACILDNGDVRDLPLYLGNDTNMSPAICGTLANQLNLNYFGIKNGVQCWGGNLTGHGTKSNDCHIYCSGDITAKCGGQIALSYYRLEEHPVYPSTETLQAAVREVWNPENDYNWTLDPYDGDDDLSYPYTMVSWIVVHRIRNLQCPSQREFFKFLNWCYTDHKAIAQLHGSKGSFSPLPSEIATQVMDQLRTFRCHGKFLLEVQYEDTNEPGMREFLMVVTSAFISFTASIMATLIRTRKSRITKAAGLVFSGAFVLGCLLNYISIYFWAFIPTSDAICQARIVFFLFGETLILGAMFSKSWEVSKIFRRVEKGDISPFQEIPWWQLCRVFLYIFVIQLILLAILMGTDAPYSVAFLTDPVNLIGRHECDVRVNTTWFILEGTFFGGLMLWGAVLAYQTRQVWTRYNYPNESRSILLSIYNLGISTVVVAPWVTLVSPDDDTLVAIASFAIIYPTTFSLSMVYLPKFVSYIGSKTSKSSKHSKGKSAGPGQTTKENTRDASAVSHRLMDKPDYDQASPRVKPSSGTAKTSLKTESPSLISSTNQDVIDRLRKKKEFVQAFLFPLNLIDECLTIFLETGFDTKDLIETITKEDLIEMKIKKAYFRKILPAVQALKSGQSIISPVPNPVSDELVRVIEENESEEKTLGNELSSCPTPSLIHRNTTHVPTSGAWRVLINQQANNQKQYTSVFDSPETLSNSKLLS